MYVGSLKIIGFQSHLIPLKFITKLQYALSVGWRKLGRVSIHVTVNHIYCRDLRLSEKYNFNFKQFKLCSLLYVLLVHS